MAESATKRRRALDQVDRELRRLITSAIDIMVTKGLISDGAVSRPWAFEIETPDGVRFRFESPIEDPRTRAQAAPPARGANAEHKASRAQCKRIVRECMELAIDPVTELAIDPQTTLSADMTREQTDEAVSALMKSVSSSRASDIIDLLKKKRASA